MPSQNLNSYYYPKYSMKLDYGQYFDLTLASDERSYDEEVVFSTKLIGEDDGNRLPIFIDLNNTGTTIQPTLNYGKYISGNTFVSKNYYNPNNTNFTCYTAYTGICDVGLVATDNGLFTKMSGGTLYYIKGIDNTYKFHPHYRDSRFKMHPVTGYTQLPNVVFSGRPKNTLYNIVSKSANTIGYYQELYGGFYQGFYKLNGYDYEVFPERVNKGWSVEMVLKPRVTNEYVPFTPIEEYLNDIYPSNAGTFFYFGTRAENKYYHNASGSPQSNSGYTRVTNELTCIESCACYNTGVTNSNCIHVYPNSQFSTIHNTGCNCGCVSTDIVPLPETDPKFDVLSSAISLRFDGCPANPSIAVKYLKITGDCVTTGSCGTTGLTFQTGYTITEVISQPIYDICNVECTGTTNERWVMISAVFERYRNLEDCDLENLGGLNDLRVVTTQSSIDGQSFKLIGPPETHSGSTPEPKIYKIRFDRKWFDELDYRLGTLKLYVNGYLFLVIEDFEEIIPRELNTEKEKQVGVPFNISFGGGTQGLHDHLIFSGCSNPFGPYRQDPELFPNNILSATTLSGISTNILLEQNFGGTFMGGISQFRMYTEPLSSPQIQHNFRILEDKFNLLNFWCPNCLTPIPTPEPACFTGCTVIMNGPSNSSVYFYNTTANTLTNISTSFSPQINFGLFDIASTSNKIWAYNNLGKKIIEYDYTPCPFSGTAVRTITTPTYLGAGLTAKDNTTLISSSGNTLITIDISTTAATYTTITSILPNRFVSGDMIYTTNNKLIVTYNDNSMDAWITQYDYTTGALEFDINVYSATSEPYGIFTQNNTLYIVDGSSSGNLFSISTTPPYNTTLVQSIGTAIGGCTSPSVTCNNVYFT